MLNFSKMLRKSNGFAVPNYLPDNLKEDYLNARKLWLRDFPGRSNRITLEAQQFEILVWLRQYTEGKAAKARISKIIDGYIHNKAESGNAAFQVDWAKRNRAGQIAGRLGKPDSSAAKKWFEAAANSGNAEALFWLGDMYETGSKATPRDPIKAADYYRQAKAKGKADAANALKRIG